MIWSWQQLQSVRVLGARCCPTMWHTLSLLCESYSSRRSKLAHLTHLIQLKAFEIIQTASVWSTWILNYDTKMMTCLFIYIYKINILIRGYEKGKDITSGINVAHLSQFPGWEQTFSEALIQTCDLWSVWGKNDIISFTDMGKDSSHIKKLNFTQHFWK